jgi:hypothetical protein
VAALAVTALVLVACNQEFVQPSEVVTEFGDGGVLTIVEEANRLSASSTHDGGLLVLDTTSGELRRFGADGEPFPGWVPPVFAGQVQFFRGILDGTVTVVTSEGGQPVLVRYSATGERIAGSERPLSGGPFFSFGMSPAGVLAVGSRTCTPESGCDGVDVQVYGTLGNLRWSASVPLDGAGGLGCSSSILLTAVQARDDGSATVAQGRCSEAAGSTPSAVAATRLTKQGAIDASYGGGAGIALLDSPAVRIVISDGGQVLAMTGSYGLRRLAPDGTVDTTFGTRSGFTYTGGPGISALVPNGAGYTITASPSGPGCAATGLTFVRYVDATGALVSTFQTPVALGGANILRYPDGSQVVHGVVQTPVDLGGGATSCQAPRTYRYLKVAAPEPAPA